MKRMISGLMAALLLLGMAACGPKDEPEATGEVNIILSDAGVTVDGKAAGADGAVQVGGELIYYHDGTGKDYGEGSAEEMHSAQEAEAHTLVTITQPGTYRVSGTLSKGQLFVDLGPGAESNPEAVVTLVLDNADITCTVAPAVFFYRVYECGPNDPETAGPEVDTFAAGANVALAAGSQNHVNGSHVAKIYQEGTDKKLHKYDGAFYSRMSMNISGRYAHDSGKVTQPGALYITGDHEGLDTELHLTINGGIIFIDADNDGINTNADGVSVVTVNGGDLVVNGGRGEEGDGIDSNGYITINGGTVWATSNEESPDGGIDADMGIVINGGSVSAFGVRNDSVSGESTQPSMALNFAEPVQPDLYVTVLREDGDPVFSFQVNRECRSITLSDASLTVGEDYQVLVGGVVQSHTTGAFGERPMRDMGDPPAMPEDMTPPEDTKHFVLDSQRPEPPVQDFDVYPIPPEGMEPPEGGPELGDGPMRGDRDMERGEGEASTVFSLRYIAAWFVNVKDA